MSKYFNDYNLHVITNVISGVETYGQRYSDERNWGDFTQAYANTSTQHSITIGWAANYGDQARQLLRLIQTDYPNDFKKNDTAGIAEDIKKSFETKPYYQPKKNSAKAKSIVAIITSDGGKKSQDKLFASLVERFLTHAIDFGINKDNIKALMMWCQIQHVGGPAPVKRIFNRCGKNPTLDQIMTALKKDQENGNTAEVGDKIFNSRHECCRKWIDEYAQSQNSTITPTAATKEETKVSVNFANYYGKISNSGSDEKGGYAGGRAGDQTGREWQIRDWYDRKSWSCVLRYPDRKVGNLIAELGIQAANNNLIGYDQYERHTYWNHLKASNYRPSQITIACQADCSAGVIANTKAAGYLLGIPALQNITATYTGDMRAAYRKAGFQVLTASKYLTGYDYLMPGDIILNDIHHVATNLGIGKYSGYNAGTGSTTPIISPKTNTPDAADKLDKTLAGKYTVNSSDGLNLRYGINKDIIVCIPNKTTVENFGYYNVDSKGKKWLYVKYNGKNGFCHSDYLKKIATTTTAAPVKTETKTTNKTLNTTKKYTGVVTANALYVRTWAGKENATLKSVPIIYKNQTVDVCDTIKASDKKDWYYIKVKGVYGFVSAEYIKKK